MCDQIDGPMLPPDIQKLLQKPDAVLFGDDVGQQLQDFIGAYTVPLFFFRDRAEPDRLTGCGSGVLLKLEDGRGFVLTAGHCVESYVQAGVCAVGIAAQRSRFTPMFGRFAYRNNGAVDFGFLEIPPSDFVKYKSYSKTYMAPGRIQLLRATELQATNDWMIASGYPGSIAVANDDGRGYRLLTYSMTLTGVGDAPASRLEAPPSSLEAIDLWRPLRGQVQTFPSFVGEVPPPDFGGASGGGCWRTNARPDPKAFNIEATRLVGIHIGTSDNTHDTSYGPCYFSREVLVGHHLRLIADEIADTRRHIFQHWPQLEDDSWAVT